MLSLGREWAPVTALLTFQLMKGFIYWVLWFVIRRFV